MYNVGDYVFYRFNWEYIPESMMYRAPVFQIIAQKDSVKKYQNKFITFVNLVSLKNPDHMLPTSESRLIPLTSDQKVLALLGFTELELTDEQRKFFSTDLPF